MNEKRDRGKMSFANLAARAFYVAEMIAAVVCMGTITFFMALGISSAMMMGRISQFKMWPDIVFAAIFMTAAAAGFRVAYVGFRYGFKGEEAEGCKKLCVLSMALFGIFDLLVILMMVLFAVVPDLSDDVTSVLQPMILSGMIGLLATFPELPAVGILLALCTSGEEAGKRDGGMDDPGVSVRGQSDRHMDRSIRRVGQPSRPSERAALDGTGRGHGAVLRI